MHIWRAGEVDQMPAQQTLVNEAMRYSGQGVVLETPLLPSRADSAHAHDAEDAGQDSKQSLLEWRSLLANS